MIVGLKNVHVPGPLQDALSAGCAEHGADWYAAVEFVRREAQLAAKDRAWELIREMRNWPLEKWVAHGLVGRPSTALRFAQDASAEEARAGKNELGSQDGQGAAGPGR